MLRYLAFALVCSRLGHQVAAQCNNATTTIRDHAEASAVGSCKTFTGSVVIATDSAPVMEIMGTETLLGDFIAANNTGLTTFASDVVDISGSVTFSNLPVLTNVTLREWLSTDTLVMERIPNPTVIDLQPDAQQITNMYVRNTSMAYFVGLTLQGSQMSVVEIVGNPYLQTINFGAGNVTQHVVIQDNSPSLDMALPHLTYAYDLQISHAAKIDLPVLGSISSGLEIKDSAVESLKIDQLGFVGGNLSISNNQNLNSVTMKKLVQVQSELEIVDNRQLKEISGLSALSSIGGSVKLVGAFDKAVLPSLSSIGGDVTLHTDSGLSCNDISPLLRGPKETCDNTSATKSSDGSGGLSGGTIAGIVIGAIAVVALIAVAIFGAIWLTQRRKRGRERGFSYDAPTIVAGNTERHLSESQTELGNWKNPFVNEEPAEMGRRHSKSYPGPEGRYELQQEEERHELDATKQDCDGNS